jgi:hypothetical protein
MQRLLGYFCFTRSVVDAWAGGFLHASYQACASRYHGTEQCVCWELDSRKFQWLWLFFSATECIMPAPVFRVQLQEFLVYPQSSILLPFGKNDSDELGKHGELGVLEGPKDVSSTFFSYRHSRLCFREVQMGAMTNCFTIRSFSLTSLNELKTPGFQCWQI